MTRIKRCIRIKESENNKSSVNVNIVNIRTSYRDTKGFIHEGFYKDAKSTGVFEKTIADLIR
jgi:3-phenylpropionate/cinnamic acid dioxygenase small subunit